MNFQKGQGNILKIAHNAAETGDWVQSYAYVETSLLEEDKTNNRLSSTIVGKSSSPNSLPTNYKYDEHGNILKMVE